MKSRTLWSTCGILLLLAASLLVLRFAIPAYREQSAMRAIEFSGGNVSVAYRYPEWSSPILDHVSEKFRGIGYLGHIEEVHQVRRRLSVAQTADFCRHLEYLPAMRILEISGSPAGDKDISRIGHLHNLEQLFLNGTAVTDAGIDVLCELTRLKELHLDETQITDRAIDILIELPALEVLHLDGTGITDAGLDKLARLKTLRELSISQTDTSDAAIDRLHEAIPGVQITDD